MDKRDDYDYDRVSGASDRIRLQECSVLTFMAIGAVSQIKVVLLYFC